MQIACSFCMDKELQIMNLYKYLFFQQYLKGFTLRSIPELKKGGK